MQTARRVVGRQLHDEMRDLAAKQRVLEEQAGENGDDDPHHVEGEHDEARARGEEGSREEGVDRQPRAAGHMRRHENRHEAVAFGVEGARPHDSRHRAPEADHHRHETLSGKSHPSHEAVHDEGGARHVTGVLERGKGEEHCEDDGNEGRHRLDAGADAAREDRHEPVRRGDRPQDRAEALHENRSKEDIEEVDEGVAHHHREPEHQVHDCEEDGNAEEPVHHHAVDEIGHGLAIQLAAGDMPGEPMDEPVAVIGNDDVRILAGVVANPLDDRINCLGGQRALGHHLFGDPRVLLEKLHRKPPRICPDAPCNLAERGFPLGDRGFELLRIIDSRGGHTRILQASIEFLLDRPYRAAIGCTRRNDGDAEMLGEVIRVDGETLLLGDVHHVEDDEEGDLQLDELQRQIEVPLEVRRIDDVHDEVDIRAEQEVPCHDLVFGACRQRIDAGQIDQVDLLGASPHRRTLRSRGVLILVHERGGEELAHCIEIEEPLFLLHGDARPVSDALLATGETVEEGGLSAVRVSRNRYGASTSCGIPLHRGLRCPGSGLRRRPARAAVLRPRPFGATG